MNRVAFQALAFMLFASCTSNDAPMSARDATFPAEKTFMLPSEPSLCADARMGIDYSVVDIRELPRGPVLVRVYSGMHPPFGSVCSGVGSRRQLKQGSSFTTTEFRKSVSGQFCREVLFEQPRTQWVLWVSYSELSQHQAARADAVIEQIKLEKPSGVTLRIKDCEPAA